MAFKGLVVAVGIAFLFLNVFIQSSLAQDRMLILSSISATTSLGWLYPSKPVLSYEPVMNISGPAKIPISGQILVPKNSSAVYFPTLNSDGDQSLVYACNINIQNCIIEAFLGNVAVNSLQFDSKKNELWFIGLNTTAYNLNSSDPQYVVGSVTPDSHGGGPVTIYTTIKGYGYCQPESALGPLQYYLLWKTNGGASASDIYGQIINRQTNQTLPAVTFNIPKDPSQPYLPSSIVYNSNSLTNITATCGLPVASGAPGTFQTCSVDFEKGTVSLPRNGTPWPYATKNIISTLESPHFYYYSVIGTYKSPTSNVWVTNAADGWTITNSTIPANAGTLWAMTIV